MSVLAGKKWFVPLVMLLLAIIAFSVFSDGEGQERTLSTEEKLRAMCNLVKGVSNAEVMIFYEPVAAAGFIEKTSTKEKISGIAIVCDGADNPSVQLALYEMVNSLFDIKSTRITISDRN